jgi:hypothetical protein
MACFRDFGLDGLWQSQSRGDRIGTFYLITIRECPDRVITSGPCLLPNPKSSCKLRRPKCESYGIHGSNNTHYKGREGRDV